MQTPRPLPFLALALPFGLLLALLLAPFQAADESRHFLRAWQIASGQLVPELQAGAPVCRVPADVLEVVRGYDDLRWHSERTVSPRRLLADLRRPRAPGPEVVAELDAGGYSPLAYLPQLPGVLLGRALRAPALAVLYLGRLSSLALLLAAGSLFLSLLPVYRRTFTLLLLLPMNLAQWAAVSADGVVIAACLLLTALLLQAALGARRLGPGTIAALCALGAVIALSKAVYLLLAGLVFLLPEERLPRWRQVLLFLLLCAVGLLGMRAWSLLSYARGFAPTSTTGRGHLELVLSAPLQALSLVLRTYVLNLPWIVETFIGRLGWVDTTLPWAVLGTYAAVLLLSALGEEPAPRWSAWQRLVLLGLFAAVLGAVALGLFIYSTYDRLDRIEGIQGRYFLPVAPLLLLGLSQRRWSFPARALARRGPWLAWGAGAGLLFTCAVVVARYYLPHG